MDITQIARDAGMIPVEHPEGMKPLWWSVEPKSIKAFAVLIRKDERERCANVCDAMDKLSPFVGECEECAEAIRELDD